MEEVAGSIPVTSTKFNDRGGGFLAAANKGNSSGRRVKAASLHFMDERTRILLVRTDRIGDVTLTTPAVSALKKKYPLASLTFLTSAYARGVLENNGDLDGIITERGFFSTLGELRRGKFGVAVVFFVNLKVALLVFLAGIPVRLGPASKLWSVFLNRRVTQRRSGIKKHEADYNLDLVKELGADAAPRGASITLTPAERTEASAVLSRLGLPGTAFIVAVHPGSGGSALNWPKENFAALADRLLENFPVKVLLTGSPAETPLLEEVASRMKGKPFILREALTLRLFTGLISRCGLFVTNSTGPLHLAAALRVPTLSFFPPIKACSPVRWGPYGGSPAKVLVPPGEACPRCDREHCARYNCMAAITPDLAFAEAAGILRQILHAR